MKNLIEKLVKVQSGLKAPKTQNNEFGKYKYRKAEDILEAVKPLLKEAGLYLSISDEILYIGNRFYLRAEATITDGDSSKSVFALAREEETKKGMDASQITGSSSSYARKYALNGLFGIDDTDDADSHKPEEPKETPKSQTTQAKPVTQPTEPEKKKKPDAPSLLQPQNEVWVKLIKWLIEKNKTEEDWPAIKPNYIITDQDQQALFEELGWLPF